MALTWPITEFPRVQVIGSLTRQAKLAAGFWARDIRAQHPSDHHCTSQRPQVTRIPFTACGTIETSSTPVPRPVSLGVKVSVRAGRNPLAPDRKWRYLAKSIVVVCPDHETVCALGRNFHLQAALDLGLWGCRARVRQDTVASIVVRNLVSPIGLIPEYGVSPILFACCLLK